MMRFIESHPDYWVSDEGIIFRKQEQGFVPLKPDMSTGHARVKLNGERLYVGQIVMEAFYPKENPYHKLFHIDGDKSNNAVSNLVWLSQSEIQLYSQYTVEYRKQILRARD